MTITNGVYPDSIKVEIFTTTWVDISAYVVGDIVGSYGIMSNDPIELVASTGRLKLTLNDVGGQFNFGATKISGWDTGIPLKLTITYGGEPVIKWYGHITKIKPNNNPWGERIAEIVVSDWLEYASTYPVRLEAVQYNKRIEEGVEVLVQGIPVKPLLKTYDRGIDTFPTLFDTSKEATRATSEFNKLALSEWGYIYIRKNPNTGEELVVENRHHRIDVLHPITTYPISTKYSGELLLQDGGFLLLETGGEILLNESETISFNDNMISTEMGYGELLKNQIRVVIYPRRLDTSNQILYSLSSPISLASNETKNIHINYRDPNNLAKQVSARDMITPVANTDYQMFQASAGTGFDLTANLSVTVIFGATDASITLINSGTSGGYVTKLNLRGLGIYVYEQSEYITSASASIDIHGFAEDSVDQKYQVDVYMSQGLANSLMDRYKEPLKLGKKVNILANASNNQDENMMLFLYGDIGDLIYVYGADGYYYINGVSFTIHQGGIIEASYTLVDEGTYYNNQYMILGNQFSTLDGSTQSRLGF